MKPNSCGLYRLDLVGLLTSRLRNFRIVFERN